jgi:hypothetical protein
MIGSPGSQKKMIYADAALSFGSAMIAKQRL